MAGNKFLNQLGWSNLADSPNIINFKCMRQIGDSPATVYETKTALTPAMIHNGTTAMGMKDAGYKVAQPEFCIFTATKEGEPVQKFFIEYEEGGVKPSKPIKEVELDPTTGLPVKKVRVRKAKAAADGTVNDTNVSAEPTPTVALPSDGDED